MDENKNETIMMHQFNQVNNSKIFFSKLILFFILIVFIGIGSGYLLAKNNGKSGGLINLDKTTNSSFIEKGVVVGSSDTKTFKDPAEGVLEKGGIGDEGQYHLVRPGGPSQYVYLTSSVIDLSKFVGRKIKVWGETQKAQKAGWLMDVGRVEVL